MVELDDFVEEDEPGEERSEHFRVDSDELAAWAMRKLRAATVKKTRNAAIASEEIARIQRWLEQANAPAVREIGYFEGLLRDYGVNCRLDPADGRKTVSLPGGKITTRPAPVSLKIDDEAFLPWARVNRQDLIKVKEEASVSAIKEAFSSQLGQTDTFVTEDGEIVPGVQAWQSDYPSVTVKPDID
jgi:hypothetical protein